jgi:2-octaprenyl-6-methoxyphenol hydroxylase
MDESYDILIVGAGLIGTSLAWALQGLGLRIGLVEAAGPDDGSRSGPDVRAIALAYGTRRIFEGMGLWQELRPRTAPIRRIHVSDRGRFGMSRLDAADQGLDALGYVVEARELGALLTRTGLGPQSGARVWRPARLVSLAALPDHVEARIQTTSAMHTLSARLIVGADGGHSTLRELAGIEVEREDYGQSAIVTTLLPERVQQGWAFERFTDSGPLAMLPLPGGRYGAVWSLPRDRVSALLSLSDRDFLQQLQQAFGGRLGRLGEPGPRQAYPLVLVRAREQARHRVLLIGNAAHTLHPVAGQGFNLGLRDVAALAEVLSEAARAGRDPGEGAVLDRYLRLRRRDHAQVIAFTDGLARLFANPFQPLVLLRNLGLVALDLAPLAKRQLALHAMGMVGRLPVLARGLPLTG